MYAGSRWKNSSGAYVVELPLSVIIFPVVENKIMMIQQYRHPVEDVIY
jgi:hypothetical protein